MSDNDTKKDLTEKQLDGLRLVIKALSPGLSQEERQAMFEQAIEVAGGPEHLPTFDEIDPELFVELRAKHLDELAGFDYFSKRAK